MTQLLENIFAVEVPKGTISVSLVSSAKEPYIIQEHVSRWSGEIPLPPGSYETLFTTKDCTEQQGAGVVEKRDNGAAAIYPFYFRDYEKKDIEFSYGSSAQSLQSLLRSHGLDPNKNYLLLKKIL